VDRFQHIEMAGSSRFAWRHPYDLHIVDEHANSVLDSKVVRHLARDGHNRERLESRPAPTADQLTR
jgi:hypothetical protein